MSSDVQHAGRWDGGLGLSAPGAADTSAHFSQSASRVTQRRPHRRASRATEETTSSRLSSDRGDHVVAAGRLKRSREDPERAESGSQVKTRSPNFTVEVCLWLRMRWRWRGDAPKNEGPSASASLPTALQAGGYRHSEAICVNFFFLMSFLVGRRCCVINLFSRRGDKT